MKKIMIFVLTGLLIFSISGCKPKTENSEAIVLEKPSIEKTTEPEVKTAPIKIATLAGPTGMGLIGLINDESGAYNIEILTQPDQISPKIINGEVDIATIPSNLAAVLYNKMGGGISVVAVNTTGVLYLLSGDKSVTSLDDLDGKTVIATGQGATPEYIFDKILAENDVEPKINFLPSHADLSNAMAAGDISIGLLPEPFVSITSAQKKDLSISIDLNEEWQKIFGDSVQLPMGVTVVSHQFLEENPKGLDRFIADYQQSVDYVNSDMDQASEDIANASLLPKAAIAKSAIPRCGISFIMGDESQAMLEDFLGVLYENNPKSIGGEMPGEEFYFKQ